VPGLGVVHFGFAWRLAERIGSNLFACKRRYVRGSIEGKKRFSQKEQTHSVYGNYPRRVLEKLTVKIQV
jgi:hypothetical protein